jgi:hypothetical protein
MQMAIKPLSFPIRHALRDKLKGAYYLIIMDVTIVKAQELLHK